MRSVLLISKPVTPPWNDSNKNLVHDLACSLRGFRPHVMVPAGAPVDAGVVPEPVYRAVGDFAPSRLANVRVLQRLVLGPRCDVWHFFFSPNPLTLRAGRAAALLRRARTVHTLASAPENLEAIAPLLFAERLVALSQHTAARLRRCGLDAEVIPPAMRAPEVTESALQRARERHGLPERYVLYPGDLEFGDGARTFLRAAAEGRDLHWVVASRPKTARAAEALVELQREAVELGARLTWLGNVEDIHAVVAGAEAVALVTNSLHGKMDWPLVLLEALNLRVPVLVGEGTAAAELAPCPGVSALPLSDPAALLGSVRKWRGLGREERQRRLEEGDRWVRERCAPEQVARAYEALYARLLER